jgi:hypothetical protein
MAQQMPYSSKEQDEGPNPQTTRSQTAGGGRYTESAAPNFTGGSIDKDTGNLQQASSLQVNRGSMPSRPEPPASLAPEPPPAPAQPTTQLAQLQAPPPPQMLPQQPVAPMQQPAPYSPPKQNNTMNIIGTIAMIGLAIFCYGKGTLVRRADGTWVRVEDIEVGDNLSLGGMVLGVGRAMAADLYEYRGTKVSGSHAVFEDGRFVRVADSAQAIKLKYDAEAELVYPIVTEKHLMVLETHIAADFAEVDGGQEMTSAQRLERLNANPDRLRILADIAGFHARAA